MKISQVGVKLFPADGRTDERTYIQRDMMKLIVAFRSFAKALKKLYQTLIYLNLRFEVI